ncbi:hypothetical protein EPYR_03514 [Erwinia pyrifoliae DSM 12163]|nr:hypothetical protein EPYR_03514 [Erwinia pyrifoliae DSM 12163]
MARKTDLNTWSSLQKFQRIKTEYNVDIGQQ